MVCFREAGRQEHTENAVSCEVLSASPVRCRIRQGRSEHNKVYRPPQWKVWSDVVAIIRFYWLLLSISAIGIYPSIKKACKADCTQLQQSQLNALSDKRALEQERQKRRHLSMLVMQAIFSDLSC